MEYARNVHSFVHLTPKHCILEIHFGFPLKGYSLSKDLFLTKAPQLFLFLFFLIGIPACNFGIRVGL